MRKSRLRPTRVLLILLAVWAASGGCAAPAEESPSEVRENERAPEGSPPTLLPDVGSRPSVAVISVTSARRAALRNAELVTNIVNGLPPSVRILVLTNDLPAFTVARDDRPGRVRFVELPTENPITIWTQDPFLVLAGGAGASETALLTSRGFERADDRVMAAAIAAATGYEVRSSELYFEGGNVVSDRDHVLIGANTIRYNALELETSELEVVLRFERELGRSVFVVGPFPQPVAHIDMMLTPLGDGRIAVADAAAGARIAERQVEDDSESVADFEAACERDFFGHPSIQEIGVGERASQPPDLKGATRRMIERSRDIAPILDGVADALQAQGYGVERIPFLFGGPESEESESPEVDASRAAYPMLTYNNVLIEDDADGLIVYLPRYGWPAMDDAAAAAWQDLGYSPHPIDGLTISAMYGGALRCSVKILER